MPPLGKGGAFGRNIHWRMSRTGCIQDLENLENFEKELGSLEKLENHEESSFIAWKPGTFGAPISEISSPSKCGVSP